MVAWLLWKGTRSRKLENFEQQLNERTRNYIWTTLKIDTNASKVYSDIMVEISI